MKKEVLYSSNAPEPIGPYSQGMAFGKLLFLSGQVAIDPKTSTITAETVEEETHQVMKNIQAMLEASGSSLEHIIKSSIFLSDMNNFSSVNEVYGSYFSSNFPARETVEVSRLPKDVKVEISVIAYR